MDLTKLITSETPFSIAFLVAVTYYLQRINSELKEQNRILQKAITQLSGVYLAVKNCPVRDCKLRDLEPLPDTLLGATAK